MIKLNSDSKWAGLTEEQRDTLEGWLFEEDITYREALERAEKEFGVVASINSIARLYRKMADERLHAELAAYNDPADKISDKLGGSQDVEDLSHAAMMLMANRVVQIARSKPNKVKEIVALAKALSQCQMVELNRSYYHLAHQKHFIEMKKQQDAAGQQVQLRAMMDQILKKQGGGNPKD